MIDAALIAGGKSRRFGEDKAFVDWRGEPLWLFQLKKLLLLDEVDRIWLSANSDQNFPGHIDGVTRLNDTVPDAGPISALKTVIGKSTAERILILAVDMPMMDRSELSLLLQSDKCQVPRQGDLWEPLAGIYPVQQMRPLIDQQIKSSDYSLQSLLNIAEAIGLISAKPVSEEQSRFYTNLNTKEEFAAIQQGTVSDCTLLRRYRKSEGYREPETDHLAREEPLEVRINGKSVSVMMRTPGHDDELATGFLFTESMIRSADEILDIEHCPDVDPEGIGNTLNVKLSGNPNLDELTRHVFTSSSCGVCGKATIDSVFQNFPPIEKIPAIDPEVILSLPKKLRARQETFDKTGGLHASALFSLDGNMHFLREDVGRHNALDKVIGKALQDQLDTSESILLVSGRISFELMQKALAAGIPVVAGISAPSSLAVDLAKDSNQVLIGFLRENGFNRYDTK
ncbi:MAG: formate dehydrogenase accessory sulfurtransferase FdhD [Verrucomicrobiales bacterium]|nr:formate dehydrogenase accessory sulfurtransferase FdhD [Verrucomicrobiales bacterium]